jgi:hypothetical protein
MITLDFVLTELIILDYDTQYTNIKLNNHNYKQNLHAVNNKCTKIIPLFFYKQNNTTLKMEMTRMSESHH